MRGWWYIAACIVVPAVWGLAASWVFDAIVARRERHRPPDEENADMYHI
jgi:hypothetical protein